MTLVKTEIDGREIEVERDRWALEVAREMGIDIPTLCYHPALEPYGACRLCVVEVTKGKWTWLTTACDLPIREGLSIRTDTPEVMAARRMALEFLWAQAPEADEIQRLARELGLQKPRFPARADKGKCILCGLCIRVCKAILGQSAISFTHRGIDRTVSTPFDEPAETCIGCNVCVAVCPTGHILSIDDGRLRKIETWKTELELAACKRCGKQMIALKHLEHVLNRAPKNMPLEDVCPACRRSLMAERASRIPAIVRKGATE
jgi:NADH dehydrogenase/NADH:ubiquinone oxidoreductase subunit G